MAALAGAALADGAGSPARDAVLPLIAAAGVLAANALGWALATEVGTHALLVVLGAAAAAVLLLVRPPDALLCTGLAATAAAVGGETAAVALSADGNVHHVGFLVLLAGGAALIVSAFVPRSRPKAAARKPPAWPPWLSDCAWPPPTRGGWRAR